MKLSSRTLPLIIGAIIALLAITSEPFAPQSFDSVNEQGGVTLPESVNEESRPKKTLQQEGGDAKLPDGTTLKDVEAVNVQGDIFIEKNPAYEIIYFKEFNSFLVSIYGSPFSQARKAAEQEFLRTIGSNSKSKACGYKVTISAPAFAHPDQAGKEYGLSFCGA